MADLNNLVLAVAAILFIVALGSLVVWAFKTYFGGSPSGTGFMRPRDKRLGVVGTAGVNANQGTPASRAAARGRDHRQERNKAGSQFHQGLEILRSFRLTVANLPHAVSLGIPVKLR